MTNCILCGSNNIDAYPSQCSPFISYRIWFKPPFKNTFIHCNNCDFSFYYPRLTESELERLYGGYRDDLYQKQRQQYEPYYTKEFNLSLGQNETNNNIRKQNTKLFLDNVINFNNINSVLDYGGADGQFTLGSTSTEKYVYDTSNVNLLPGIKRINSLDESIVKFDLIQCCYVLEHVTDIHYIINRLIKHSHKNTQFLFEVPGDTPMNSSRIQFFIRHPIINDIYSLVTNQKDRVLFNMHEHINHFTIKSLTYLMSLHGLEIQKVSDGASSVINIPTISCVAKHNSETFIIQNVEQ